MKNGALLLCSLLVLILTGCSSIYTQKDFPSKQKFYEDFNNSVRNKKVIVTLTNDSLINLINAEIKNDSLLSKEFAEPVDRIKEVSYKSHLESTVIGFAAGTPLGIITGLIGYGVIDSNNSQEKSKGAGNFLEMSTVAGFAGGIIIGWLTGFNYTYQFNP